MSVAVVALAAGGAHLAALAPSSKLIHSQSASANKSTVPLAVAQHTVTSGQSAPTPTPTPVSVSVPAPLQPVTLADVPHSAAPAPVVTPAPAASVSGLVPVDPTPAPSSSNSQGSSSSGSSSSSSSSSPTTTTGYTSTNWSGYLATTGKYTAIAGSWTVPKPTGIAGKTSADAAWIGIGGVSTGDLIQVGTEDTVSASGQETSSAFYELLPQASTTITALTVSPGDAITASLAEPTTGQWTVNITDLTTGKSYTTTLSYTSSNSSAEWIEEDPSTVFGRLLPLDNFTSVSFTGGTTTSSGTNVTIAGSNAQPVTLVSATTDQPVATPSLLGSSGQAFTVTQD